MKNKIIETYYTYFFSFLGYCVLEEVKTIRKICLHGYREDIMEQEVLHSTENSIEPFFVCLEHIVHDRLFQNSFYKQ